MESKLTATTILVLLLLTSGAEANKCDKPSRTFVGICYYNMLCAMICVREKSGTGGSCRGVPLFRKCICEDRRCEAEGAGGPPPAELRARAPRRAGIHG
ncbi:hypothetical protein BS78_02G321000 [Paspalum vaginatum]|nr:hypothetical protein BS78_02G321000 [Paspalum vaginatum]